MAMISEETVDFHGDPLLGGQNQFKGSVSNFLRFSQGQGQVRVRVSKCYFYTAKNVPPKNLSVSMEAALLRKTWISTAPLLTKTWNSTETPLMAGLTGTPQSWSRAELSRRGKLLSRADTQGRAEYINRADT